MSNLLSQGSSSLRPNKRGEGGAGDGSRVLRGSTGPSRGRGRGSRLASAKPITTADLSSPDTLIHLTNGEESITGSTESADESESSRQERFNKTDSGNQYEQLKIKREAERRAAIAQGLIADPDKPRSLSEAIRFVGTCPDMCPEFEMHQREYQNNVEKWETDPHTGRVDKSRAVKAFHRPAAGNEQPLPSDVRPPAVLVRTLDYLFGTILEGGDDMSQTHAFIRDRTRSIRQDFTVQNYRGREAIECHERIASEQQEMEQLRKVLQSLMEFYKDTKTSSFPLPLPNEAEFRAYYALVFLYDHDVSRQLQTLQGDIFFSAPMTRSLRIRGLAQRSNDKFVQNNAEAAPNSFVRFFKDVRLSTTFLEACILETWFGSIRIGAFKALRQALGVKAAQVSQVSVPKLEKLLGFDDTGQLIAFCDYLGLEVVEDDDGEPKSIWFKRSVPWEEPVTYLHQFSRTIVESKRGSLSNQFVVNGIVTREQTTQRQLTNFPLHPSTNIKPRQSLPFNSARRPLVANGTKPVEKSKDLPTSLPQQNFQPIGVFEPSQSTKSPAQSIFSKALDIKPPLSPIPHRAKKSPILYFKSPIVSRESPVGQIQDVVPHRPEVSNVFQPSAPLPVPIGFSKTHSVSTEIPEDTSEDNTSTKLLVISSSFQPREERPGQSEQLARRKLLFERQEKLLYDELLRQESARQSKLDSDERERQKSLEAVRKQNLERELARQRESVQLKNQKIATTERESREQAQNEIRKAQREKDIQFFTDEIVNSIVQEHILEVNADVLAIGFYCKWLLSKVLHHLKKVSTRSLKRKEQYLEQIKLSRTRKGVLSRALAELDRGETANLTKKPPRRSNRAVLESEVVLNEILSKAREESKELWKPMDLKRNIAPYVDAVLSREGLQQVEWDILVLSVKDEIDEETRWLRTKFGFGRESEYQVQVPSSIAKMKIVWSSVMQFNGSLENVGALIFVYERSCGSIDPTKPGAKVLLHEVVRQTSLQSRFKHPVLIINFNDTLTDASEAYTFMHNVARELDLRILSQVTPSVPAFQVLTIGALGEANLEASIQSFLKHVSGSLNEVIQEVEKDKKRKRIITQDLRDSPPQVAARVDSLVDDESPLKKVRSEEVYLEQADVRKMSLPKSIESLYKTIMRAQEELEAGKI